MERAKSTLAQSRSSGPGSRNKTAEAIPEPNFYTDGNLFDQMRGAICHADLYRLDGPEELRELGLEDYFQTHLTFIEWPEQGAISTATAFSANRHRTGKMSAA